MHPEERQLTRDDFLAYEDWLRYCHEGGLDPIDEADNGSSDCGQDQLAVNCCRHFPAGWAPVAGNGFYAELYRATYGWTRRQYAVTHEGYGVTDYLDGEHFLRAYSAVALANTRGRTMNAYLTITWSTVGVVHDEHVARLQGEFLEGTRKWLRERGYWAAWVWVLERGKKRGLHSHMALGLPFFEKLDFRAWAKQRLESLVGTPLLDTPESKTMHLEVRAEGDIESQWRWFRYLMKGIHPDWGWPDASQPTGARYLWQVAGIEPQQQGEVRVKRLGVSRQLDAASFAELYPADLPQIDLSAVRSAADLYDDRHWRWHLANAPLAGLPYWDSPR